MASSTNFNTVLVHTDQYDGTAYLYEYLWSRAEKVQNSWSEVKFDYTPIFSFFVGSSLYIVGVLDGEASLYVLDLDAEQSGDYEHSIHLDRHIVQENVEKTFTVPYSLTAVDNMPPEDYIVVSLDEDGDTGLIVEVESYDDTTGVVTLEEDLGGQTIMFGKRFETRFKPTMPQFVDRDGEKVSTGTLIINNFYIQTEDSGDFNWSISSDYEETRTYAWSGFLLNNPTSLLSLASVSSSLVQLDFGDENDLAELTITSNSHLPLRITDIEWDGLWLKRGTRI